ncbi:MAG: hypothetical protein HN348_19785, partial [Proteobacteria bacterium]|nr:hypothetical protein [Pseudomonadota bacterium]
MNKEKRGMLVFAGAGLVILAALVNHAIERPPTIIDPNINPPPIEFASLVPQSVPDVTPKAPRKDNLVECTASGTATARPTGDARVRDSAQKGLDFLARSTVRWQQTQQCYGCHVQAVTLKAMAVGRHHDYRVDQTDLETVKYGMTGIAQGGSRTGGLRYSTGTFLSAAKSLGGSAFARYDEWVNSALTDDLIQTSQELLEMQGEHGEIINDYTHTPVAIGALQDTVLAMVTWNQAYSRTADDNWLTAVGRAEEYVRQVALGWENTPPYDIQSINYALMGFQAANSGTGERVVDSLIQALISRQNEDGGWALQGGPSDAYATGQTLYVLRLQGKTETDATVARGTNWLLDNQNEDGGWSHSGRERAEAMWGVLGLVSVDVLTLSVAGLEDGQHVSEVREVLAEAFDNQGGEVVSIEMAVDDVPVQRQCKNKLVYQWNTSDLEPGPHIVDLIAENSSGKRARRRLTVYAGPVYLTRVGNTFDDGGTVITLRNIAPESLPNGVNLEIVHNEEVIFNASREGIQGPMRFFWDGKNNDGQAMANDKYQARLSFVSDGKVLQTEELEFVHDTLTAQLANYGQVEGQLRLDGEIGANTMVELLDGAGSVITSTVTTDGGNYRFRNVQGGSYKVRVSKKGWGAAEMAMVVVSASGMQVGAWHEH